MDIDSFLREQQSRRRFFASSGVSIAGGSAMFLAACSDDDGEPQGVRVRKDAEAADVEVLNGALDLELMAVAGYKTGAAKLRGEALQIGKLFIEQEQEHADALSSAIKDAGGTPNRAKSSYDFPELRSQRDALNFAVGLENTAVAAYIDALPKLTNTDLRGTASAILTTEAEHISVLLGALGRPPAPHAFVTGEAA
jgi:rubrerythrin